MNFLNVLHEYFGWRRLLAHAWTNAVISVSTAVFSPDPETDLYWTEWLATLTSRTKKLSAGSDVDSLIALHEPFGWRRSLAHAWSLVTLRELCVGSCTCNLTDDINRGLETCILCSSTCGATLSIQLHFSSASTVWSVFYVNVLGQDRYASHFSSVLLLDEGMMLKMMLQLLVTCRYSRPGNKDVQSKINLVYVHDGLSWQV